MDEIRALQEFARRQKEQQEKLEKVMKYKNSTLSSDDQQLQLQQPDDIIPNEELALDFDPTAFDDPESKVALRFKLTPLAVFLNIFFTILVSFLVGIAQTRVETCPGIIQWIAFVNAFTFVFNLWMRPYIVPLINILQSSMDCCAMAASILAARAQSAYEEAEAQKLADIQAGRNLEDIPDTRSVIDDSAAFIQVFVSISLTVLSMVLLASRVFPFVSLRLVSCLIMPKRLLRKSEKIVANTTSTSTTSDEDEIDDDDKKKTKPSDISKSTTNLDDMMKPLTDENGGGVNVEDDDDDDEDDDDDDDDDIEAYINQKKNEVEGENQNQLDDAFRNLLNNNNDNDKNNTSSADLVSLPSSTSHRASFIGSNSENNNNKDQKTENNNKTKNHLLILDLSEVDPDLNTYSRDLIDTYRNERIATRLEEEAKKRQQEEQEELEKLQQREHEQKQQELKSLQSNRPLSEKLFTFFPPKVPEHLPDAANPRANIRSGWDRRFDEIDDRLRQAHQYAIEADKEMDDEDNNMDENENDDDAEMEEKKNTIRNKKDSKNKSSNEELLLDESSIVQKNKNKNNKQKSSTKPQQHEKFKIQMQMDDFFGI